MPQVQDPFFHKSVVLLVHQDEEEGSFGFIVNRPTEFKVRDILEGMEITWQGPEADLAFFGGPVQPQMGSVLFPVSKAEDDKLKAASEIAPGIAITQHIGDLSSLASEPPSNFRLILGYAGWSDGQLVEEIQRNDWLIAPFDGDLMFGDESETIWERCLRSLGVDPINLPRSPAPTDDDQTAAN